MNKTQKNIVIVGFSDIEKRSIKVPPIKNNYYLNSMEEARKHQGFLLIINNKDNLDIIAFDKKYRKITNKYAYIWLYNEKYKESINKWSRIETKNRDIFYYDELTIWDMYDEYKHSLEHKKETPKYTQKRLNNINKIYNYLQNYKTIKTSKISEDLKINDRMVQRYMEDINNIYHNIGYDYSSNEWYIIW